jgi:hypothetical protein
MGARLFAILFSVNFPRPDTSSQAPLLNYRLNGCKLLSEKRLQTPTLVSFLFPRFLKCSIKYVFEKTRTVKEHTFSLFFSMSFLFSPQADDCIRTYCIREVKSFLKNFQKFLLWQYKPAIPPAGVLLLWRLSSASLVRPGFSYRPFTDKSAYVPHGLSQPLLIFDQSYPHVILAVLTECPAWRDANLGILHKVNAIVNGALAFKMLFRDFCPYEHTRARFWDKPANSRETFTENVPA